MEAQAASKAAEKELAAMKKASAKAINDCSCRVLGEFTRVWAVTQKAINKEEMAKAWAKAKQIMCVIDGTPQKQCKTGGMPEVKKPKLAVGVTQAFCKSE